MSTAILRSKLCQQSSQPPRGGLGAKHSVVAALSVADESAVKGEISAPKSGKSLIGE
jgi:hypothetical protein